MSRSLHPSVESPLEEMRELGLPRSRLSLGATLLIGLILADVAITIAALLRY
jgi:hypothetical protein